MTHIWYRISRRIENKWREIVLRFYVRDTGYTNIRNTVDEKTCYFYFVNLKRWTEVKNVQWMECAGRSWRPAATVISRLNKVGAPISRTWLLSTVADPLMYSNVVNAAFINRFVILMSWRYTTASTPCLTSIAFCASASGARGRVVSMQWNLPSSLSSKW